MLFHSVHWVGSPIFWERQGVEHKEEKKRREEKRREEKRREEKRREEKRRDLIAALLPFRLLVERLQILHIFNIIIPILVR